MTIELNSKNICSLLRQEYFNLDHANKENNYLKINLANNEIERIKKYHEENIRKKREEKNDESLLIDVECSLIIDENERFSSIPTTEELQYFKKSLEENAEDLSSSMTPFFPSKWTQPSGEVVKEARDVFNFVSPKNANKEETKRSNLLKRVNDALRKRDEEALNDTEQQDCFSLLYDAFHSKNINAENLLKNLITFYKDVNGDMNEYQKALQFWFGGLTKRELQHYLTQMKSPEMISLTTAFLSQRWLAPYPEDLPENEECQDAVSLVSEENTAWTKLKEKLLAEALAVKMTYEEAKENFKFIKHLTDSQKEELQKKLSIPSTPYEVEEYKKKLILQLPDYRGEIKDIVTKFPQALTNGSLQIITNEKFFATAGHMFSLISRFYISIELEINRKNKKPENKVLSYFPYVSKDPMEENEWITDTKTKKLKKIVISEEEKQLIGSAVQMMVSEVSEASEEKKIKKTLLLRDRSSISYSYNNQPVIPLEQKSRFRELLGQHFGKMIQSLGFFFNPHKFVDALYTFQANADNIRDKISKMEDQGLKDLYEDFKSEDLNSLVALLGHIKKGNQQNLGDLYDKLSIKRAKPIEFNNNFKKLSGQLYDSAHTLMQTVKSELIHRGIITDEEYSYNNYELTEESMLTNKNIACLKRVLSEYYPEKYKADYTVKLGLWDRFYYWFYPSDKEIQMIPRVSVVDLAGNCEKDGEDMLKTLGSAPNKKKDLTVVIPEYDDDYHDMTELLI